MDKNLLLTYVRTVIVEVWYGDWYGGWYGTIPYFYYPYRSTADNTTPQKFFDITTPYHTTTASFAQKVVVATQ